MFTYTSAISIQRSSYFYNNWKQRTPMAPNDGYLVLEACVEPPSGLARPFLIWLAKLDENSTGVTDLRCLQQDDELNMALREI